MLGLELRSVVTIAGTTGESSGECAMDERAKKHALEELEVEQGTAVALLPLPGSYSLSWCVLVESCRAPSKDAQPPDHH